MRKTIRKAYWVGLGLLLCSSSLAFSQDIRTRAGATAAAQPEARTVSGRVVDAQGAALAGATVQVLDPAGRTITGTYTDANGNYSVSIPGGTQAILRISYLNYSTQDLPVTGSNTYAVTLQEDLKQLDEVVVTGYGVQSRRDLTASIATVKGDAIKDTPVQSFDQALQGRMAGVNIVSQNGQVNNNPIIRIRGMNSITSSNAPLIVVDGVFLQSGNVGSGIVQANQLGNINPNDIESMEVLKDAAATAQYGSRGAAGVILITTKRGRLGQTTATYDAWIGWSETFREIDLLNASEFQLIKNEGWVNGGNHLIAGNPAAIALPYAPAPADVNWYDVAFRTGFQQNHTVSISGGSEKINYYVSLNHSDQEAFIRNNNFRRYSGRANVDYKPNKWLKIGTNMQISGTRTEAPNTGAGGAFASAGIGRLVWATAPNSPIRLVDGSFNIGQLQGTIQHGLGGNLIPAQFGQNIQYILDRNIGRNDALQILGNAYAELTPVKGLTVRSSYGVDNNVLRYFQFFDPLTVDGVAVGGTTTQQLLNLNTWTFTNTASYNTKVAEKHNLGATVAAEYIYRTTNAFSGTRNNIVDRAANTYGTQYLVNNTAGGENKFGQASYLGNLNYNYAQKYYVGANVRRDALSTLPRGNRWGTFYAASAAYRISAEPFFENLIPKSIVSDFRIRASWGITGNTNFWASPYDAITTFTPALYAGSGAFLPANLGNPNLRWEQSEKTDIGFDLGLLEDRVTVVFAYYENDVTDLILNSPLAPSKGVPGSSFLDNVGGIRNSGIELSVNSVNINSNGIRWTTTVNLTTLNNEVTATNATNSDIQFNTGGLELTSIARVGQPLGVLWAVPTLGVNPANGHALFRRIDGQTVQYNHAAPTATRWTLLDGTISRAIGAQDYVVSGNPLPTYEGGLGNNVSWKGFDLEVFFVYSGGNRIYAGTRAQLLDQRFTNNAAEILDRWTTPGQQTNIPRVVFGDNVSNGSTLAQTRNIFDGDFIRCRNILLGYNLPKDLANRFSLNTVRFYAQVQNAFIITDYPYTDPEANTNREGFARGIDRNALPQARTWSVGTTITF